MFMKHIWHWLFNSPLTSIVIHSFPDCHEPRVGNRSISDEVDRHCVPRADDGAWYVRTTISLFYRTEIDLNIVVWTYVVFTSCWRAIIEASGVLMAGLCSVREGFKKEGKCQFMDSYPTSTPMLDLSYCFSETSRFCLPSSPQYPPSNSKLWKVSSIFISEATSRFQT